jgi:hypothetical protein
VAERSGDTAFSTYFGCRKRRGAALPAALQKLWLRRGIPGQYHHPVSAKAEIRNPKCSSVASAFGIRPSFGFRPSVFGFGRLAADGTFQMRPLRRKPGVLLRQARGENRDNGAKRAPADAAK